MEPRCRLQEEDSDEYGQVITPETAVAEAIRERTESLLHKTGGTVSAKPIVMRAEYVSILHILTDLRLSLDICKSHSC